MSIKLNRALTYIALIAGVKSSASLLRDDQPTGAAFPLYSTVTAAPWSNAAGAIAYGFSSAVHYGGYQCIR